MRLVLNAIILLILFQPFSGCFYCMGGGVLVARQTHIYNKCGMSSGVTITELRIDSFTNNLPSKYSDVEKTRLYLNNDKLYNDPKRLYFSRHCHVPFADSACRFVLKPNTWYSANVANYLQTFFYVDEKGKVVSYD